MADISTELARILSAIYGEDVRGSIHDAIEKINDVSEVVLTTGTAVTGPSSSSTGFYDDSLYLNTDTFELWKCTGVNTWASQGILKGDPGEDGNGIASITKTATSGLVDTYTITYTDGTTDTFSVTNGANGTDGSDGVSVTGVSLLSKVGLLATYRMTFSNGTYFDYTVSDGASGSGTGDMTKAVYDTDNDGIVDAAETLSGLTATIADLNKTANLATVATSGRYNDLGNKPTIPTITDTYSSTSSDGMSGKAVKSAIDALDKSDSAVSGQYVSAVSETDGIITVSRASLPTIPTVNDGQLTIQQNGTNKATFTANQSGNATANIVTDDWVATGTVSSGSVSFSGIDDSGNYGYKPFAEVTASSTNKNPSAQISTLSGTGTSSMSVTYTTDADDGTTVKLRRIK